MFSVANNGIMTVSRGDAFSTTLFINLGTVLDPARYTLISDDILCFAITEPHQDFEHAIIKKVFTKDSPVDEDGDIIISFKPEDTEYLAPGVYYYQVKLRRHLLDESGSITGELVDTIIAKTKFIILD